MSDETDVAGRILTEVLALGPRIGKLEAACELTNARLGGIDRRLERGSSQMQGYGTEIAKHETRLQQFTRDLEETRIEVARRHARLSEQLAAMGVQVEDTGVHHIIEEKARWRTLRWAALILTGALSICATVVSLSKCNEPAAPAAAQRR